MLRKMTRHAFTVESCTASLAKSYNSGFVVKAGVKNGHIHYAQELKINVLFVKYVYQIKAMLCMAVATVWLFCEKQFCELKKLLKILGLVNRNISLHRSGNNIYCKDIKWIYVDTFGVNKFKMSHREDEPWQSMNILNLETSNQPADGSSVQTPVIPQRLVTKCNIKPAEAADVRKQMAFTPCAMQPFYVHVDKLKPVAAKTVDLCLPYVGRCFSAHTVITQHGIGTCEASRFDSISNRTSDSGFDS